MRENTEIILQECRKSFDDGFMPLLNKYLRSIDEERDDIFIDYITEFNLQYELNIKTMKVWQL